MCHQNYSKLSGTFYTGETLILYRTNIRFLVPPGGNLNFSLMTVNVFLSKVGDWVECYCDARWRVSPLSLPTLPLSCSRETVEDGGNNINLVVICSRGLLPLISVFYFTLSTYSHYFLRQLFSLARPTKPLAVKDFTRMERLHPRQFLGLYVDVGASSSSSSTLLMRTN